LGSSPVVNHRFAYEEKDLFDSKRETLPMNQSFVTGTIRKLGRKIGAQVVIEPEYGFVGWIVFKNGKRSFFRGASLDINPQGSADIARDKAYTAFFLHRLGYNVPYGQTFFSDELCEKLPIKRNICDGYEFAQSIGFPVIVKPNDLAQGTLVAKVYNKKEYLSVVRRILRRTQVFLVQKLYSGRDYRVVVLDDEVLAAYERIPLFVIGNGASTIAKLLDSKRKNLAARNRKLGIDLQDIRTAKILRRRHLSPGTVLPRGTQLHLLDNANLSSGGEAIDVTNEIHPSFRALAVSATKAMGLRLCGVDIMTDDLTRSVKQQKDYVFLEMNASPGLENYAAIGREQALRVEDLYLKVLRKIERQ
jgi:D-alanine-D-alanine ligase-like ATP-grasp enzyme